MPNAAVRHVDAVESLLSTLGATLIEPKSPSLGQRGDRVDDHIVSHKNDYAALYRCYGVLPWRSRLKINFCEMFGVVRFFDFCNIIRQKRRRLAQRAPGASRAASNDDRNRSSGSKFPARVRMTSSKRALYLAASAGSPRLSQTSTPAR